MLSEEGVEKIKLSSRQSHVHDIWAMQFFPYGMKEGKHYKLSELAVMERDKCHRRLQRKDSNTVFACNMSISVRMRWVIRYWNVIWKNLILFCLWGTLLNRIAIRGHGVKRQ